MTVSIIIPCYNQAEFLSDAIESCLAQTVQDFEIIVVDDGSTDNTREVAARYPQVKYLYQANSGPGSARNTGLRQARGEFLQFLDADDMLLPEKLERSLAVFGSHPQVGLVYTNFEVRTADMSEPLTPQLNERAHLDRPEGDALKQLVNSLSTFFAPHCALTRRLPVLAVGGFNEKLHGTEDWFMWVSLAAHGVRFAHVDQVLAWYREHPRGVSRQSLPLAYARLHAYQALRELELGPGIIDLDQAIAGRHHVLGIRLWQENRQAEARMHFRQAIRLDQGWQLYRRALVVLSYLFSMDRAVMLLNMLQRARHRA